MSHHETFITVELNQKDAGFLFSKEFEVCIKYDVDWSDVDSPVRIKGYQVKLSGKWHDAGDVLNDMLEDVLFPLGAGDCMAWLVEDAQDEIQQFEGVFI